MDMTYETISVFEKQSRLYMETLMKYMVSSEDKPNKYLLYFIHSEMDSFIQYNDICLEEEVSNMEIQSSKTEDVKLKSKT